MPRNPKPVALRANRERRDIGLVPMAGRALARPDPPPGLLATSLASWDRFWSSPLARITVPDTDGDAIARLWTLKDERTRIYRAIRRERMVRGSKGQPRANPLYMQLASLDSAIQQLEDRFGMSAKSRLQLGVILGDAARSLEDVNADLEDDEDLAELVGPSILDGSLG